MLKATIVFCLLGVVPCTKDNAVLVIPREGEYQFAPMCQVHNIKEAQRISTERFQKAGGVNKEYFKILCEPK